MPPTPPITTPLGVLARRPRAEGDAGLVLALFASTRQAELDLLGWGEEQRRAFLELQLRARDQHRDATRPGAELSVVTLDGTPVGQLDLARDEDGSVEVLEIAVLPGLRGHGLGTAVLAQVLADAHARDVAVRLHVEHGNPAHRLYQRLGFVPAGESATHVALVRPAGIGTGDDPIPELAPGGMTTAGAAPPPAPGLAPGEEPVGTMPTYAALTGQVGAPVSCLPDGPELAVAAVDATRAPRADGHQPFSLLLEGPRERPLGQGVHRLRLPAGDVVDLFLVPLQPTRHSAVYEIIIT